MRFILSRYLALVLAAGWAVAALGNNMRVTNTAVAVYQPDAGLAQIRFDIAWENSWRYTNINHDAAWVFFKARKEGATDWTHVKLAGTGINPAGCSTGTGTGIELIVPDDGMGVFVRRAEKDTSGAVSVQNARVVWNFITNGLTQFSRVQIQTLAIEMVYVAEGAFYVGDGLNDAGQLFEGGGGTNPFLIVSEAAILCTNEVGGLWNGSPYGGFNSIGGDGYISNAYPKGYAAFYCMKYEITQGQYTDFLNLLTAIQATNRYSTNSTDWRYTIGTNTSGVYTNGAPDRACNFLSCNDGQAFADWSGLRPMTELEFEKACRGTNTPVAGEFAWGTISGTRLTDYSGTDGSGTETALPTNANCNYNHWYENEPRGPVRVGIFATGSSSREAAGASYWGIMEMSGNVFECPVNVTAIGRAFTGGMGDGTLTAAGDANVPYWPGTANYGFGVRGGEWYNTTYARVSDRTSALSDLNGRGIGVGWRSVRSAPSGVGP